MDRRNFIKGAVAVPAVALTAKLPVYKHNDGDWKAASQMVYDEGIWSEGLKEAWFPDKDRWHL